jgi:hypothetical protein
MSRIPLDMRQRGYETPAPSISATGCKMAPCGCSRREEREMKKSALWLAGAGAAALGLSGCTASPTPPTASQPASPIMLSARVIPNAPDDSVPVRGTIVLDESCVSISPEDGKSIPVVWPENGCAGGRRPGRTRLAQGPNQGGTRPQLGPRFLHEGRHARRPLRSRRAPQLRRELGVGRLSYDLGSEHHVCVGHAQASHEVALALMPGTNERSDAQETDRLATGAT